MKLFTSEQLRERLAAEVKRAGGQTAWAGENGLSVSYVSDLLNERKEFSATVADVMGYERELRFRRRNGKR